MRRLIRRDRRERGAVAVVVAISMVVLMGFVAISVDVGSIYDDRQQLQNGADAAALAIAESCRRDPTKCSDSANKDSAEKYAQANKLDGQATGTVVKIDRTAGKVTVEARTPEQNPHQNWFAGVLGKDMSTTDIRAYASARWRNLSGGTTLPLIFSWCAFIHATGGSDATTGTLPGDLVTLDLNQNGNNNQNSNCTPPGLDQPVPGGFAWLVTDNSTNCVATVLAGSPKFSDTGIDGPEACKQNLSWTETLLTSPVQVPIYDAYDGSGGTAKYHVIGLAAFQISAFCFSNKPEAQSPGIDKCPSQRRIVGNFTTYVALSGEWSSDPPAPNFGGGVVNLIPTEMPVA